MISAIISAVTGFLAAAAACWSAAAASHSNKLAARERRGTPEREANRGISAVPPATARVIQLGERLARDYMTLFALAGRNISAAAPLREQIVERRRAAEEMTARARAWLPGPIEKYSGRELQDVVHAMDDFALRLEQLEESLVRPHRRRT